MINFHKDHANLVNVALLVFALLSTGIAVAPALTMQDNNAPLPDMPKMTDQERRGLSIYVAEGCIGCHTQQVRNIEMDKTWGDRPSMPSDYFYSKERPNIWQATPSLLGSERTGPDLTNVGKRQASEAWQMLHLYNPRLVVKGSVMPRYGWLQRNALRIDDLGDHLSAQRAVGVPYTDAMIENATADARGQANPDGTESSGVSERYGEATNVRAFDGNPGLLTEMDALVAYLQVVGQLTQAAHHETAAKEE